MSPELVAGGGRSRERNRSRPRRRPPTTDGPDVDQDRLAEIADETGIPPDTIRQASRRTANGRSGTVEDLRVSAPDRTQSQVLPGAGAALSIDDRFNPGFVGTQVVNRMGLVLSLSMVWNQERSVWEPLTTAQTAQMGLDDRLVTNAIYEALSQIIANQDGTTLDANDDLVLASESGDSAQTLDQTPTNVLETVEEGFRFRPTADVTSMSLHFRYDWDTPPGWYIVRESDMATIARQAYAGSPMTFDYPFQSGETYRFKQELRDGSLDSSNYDSSPYPIALTHGDFLGGWQDGYGEDVDYPGLIRLETAVNPESGTASTAALTDVRSTNHGRALYNAAPNGGGVKVDLYEGDPTAAGSTLLRPDITPREDLSDLEPSRGPLHLKANLERSPDGSSPKVTKLGAQYLE